LGETRCLHLQGRRVSGLLNVAASDTRLFLLSGDIFPVLQQLTNPKEGIGETVLPAAAHKIYWHILLPNIRRCEVFLSQPLD
jgi:ABC-type sulfate transport system permease subunit